MGFELSQISVRVLLMHGREDRFVPVTHSEWLAERIPGAEVQVLASEGHLTLLTSRIGEVHEWLLTRLNG